MTEKTIRVSWIECDCPWTTKYCEEYHTKSANVPISVLKQYEN